MSAIKDMVAGECGTSNALVRAAQHFTKDHAFQHEGLRGQGGIWSLFCFNCFLYCSYLIIDVIL